MFTIRKQGMKTHWKVWGSTIYEYFGPADSDAGNEFSGRIWAYDYAYRKVELDLKKSYTRLRDRYPGFVQTIHKIRAIFSPSFRKSLKEWNEKIEAARLKWGAGPIIEEQAIPDELTADGIDLPNGTSLYRVDTYNPDLKQFTITDRTVSYYSHEGKAQVRYVLDDDKTIAATLASGFSNYTYYLDKEEAVMVLRGLLENRMADIEKQLKSL